MRATPLPDPAFLYRALGPTMAAAVATLLGLPSAHAQGQGPGPGSDDQSSSWSLGIGVMSAQKPYAGIDREAKAIPMIQLENRYVRVRGLGLEVKLPGLVISDTQRLNFSIVGRGSAGGGYEADDAPVLGGMAERKSGFWAGAKVEWETGLVDVTADWTADASSHSKGQKFSLGVAKSWRLGQHVMLIPRLGATWQDRKYNDYYFGVRDSEVRPGRAAYRADAGVNAEVGLTGIYMFDRHHSAMLSAAVTSLSKEIKNSHLVDRSTENRVMAAYIYRF